ncbi:MAG: sigma-54 dependent transcriptional regulator, partial [Bacillota bacterium]|nr:sigma-54 dependent transcriptional regulator [Bacillota bacterium]
MRRILVADDEANMRWVLERALIKAGYEVETVEDGQLALDRALAERPDLVLVDLKMPKKDGLSVLYTLKEHYPDLLMIMMTAHGSTATAVEAMKAGAQDYLMKPFDIDELLITVDKAFEVESLREQVNYLKGEAQHDGWQLVGNSERMQAVKHLAERVAPTPATVLIQGESGTGKELVAQAIHTLSPRVGGPFIRVNCAALTETLLESELFGHEKGAFTGAHARKTGRFELADGGTLFLDEIGELSFNVQAKLLRVLQERSFERVGGEKTIKVDVRIVAATNRDLLKEV